MQIYVKCRINKTTSMLIVTCKMWKEQYLLQMMGGNSRCGMSMKVIKKFNMNGGCGMSRIMSKGCIMNTLCKVCYIIVVCRQNIKLLIYVVCQI